MKYTDRFEAGKYLAGNLKKYKSTNSLVLALPRGGVPVAYIVAKSLNLPLEVLVSRKIGAPNNPEFGIGAISENSTVVLDKELIKQLKILENSLSRLKMEEERELKRRINKYRKGKKLPNLKGKTAIIIDDGLATGVTAFAAVEAVNKLKPERLVLAVPVCAKETAKKIKEKVDEFYCNFAASVLKAIGLYYEDFGQISDREVIKLLKRAEDRFAK
jgi:putative phosphoribosyl transferase